MGERFADGVVTAASNDDGVQGGAKAVQFQRQFSARDRMDDEMNQKMQLMDKDGMTPFGQVYYDDKVGKWLERKQAVAETANLDAWFNENFNKNNLADRQFAQQIYPEFYDSREQEMIKRAKEAVKLKMIQLRGPQSKDDMYKLWLINTGRVQLPDDWDRIGPSAKPNNQPDYDAAQSAAAFKAGLFRLPKFSTTSQRETAAEQAARVGLWGQKTAAPNRFNEFLPTQEATRNRPLTQRPDDATVGMRGFQYFQANP